MNQMRNTERLWYDTEGHRTITESELREEYEGQPADQRACMTFEEYIRMGEAETLRRISSEIEDARNPWTKGTTQFYIQPA